MDAMILLDKCLARALLILFAIREVRELLLVWHEQVFMEPGTQAVPGINTSETDLRTNFGSMRVLWKCDSISMSSMVGSPLSRSPMLMICFTHMTRVAKLPSHCWKPL